jgi:uncharacterized protein (DUF2147 family)
MSGAGHGLRAWRGFAYARGMSRTVPLAAFLLILPAAGVEAATPIAGRWLTADGGGEVTVGPCGGTVCGRLTRIIKSRPGAAATDVNNADPALRGRPIQGLPILSGFSDQGKDWRGTIYDPRNGRSYKSVVSRSADGTLAVKGCISFICRTQVWIPAK